MKILVVGGSGYIGSVLIPMLKHEITIYDSAQGQDVRDQVLFSEFCKGQDAVIYLASLSNNDLCNLYPERAKSINEDSFPGVIKAVQDAGVKHFIYASSVAAYGNGDNEFTEKDYLSPTTIYGQGKAFCEHHLGVMDVRCTIIRAATVCGWSPVMRWDTTVNKMVHDALHKRVITINGGEQKRCYIHIQDLCEFYCKIVDEQITGVFNVVNENESITNTASKVANIVGAGVVVNPSTDNRSYTVLGQKAKHILDWSPILNIHHAVKDILAHV